MEEEKEIAEKLYSMRLGEMTCFNNNSSWLRVPGGWVYGDLQGTTFIPFDNEFMKLINQARG